MDREVLLVADAGPIIALASIGRFGLLQQLASKVMVPRSVHAEVLAGAPRPGAKEVAEAKIEELRRGSVPAPCVR